MRRFCIGRDIDDPDRDILWSLEAERGLISCVIEDHALVTQFSAITASDFIDPRNALVWATILWLSGLSAPINRENLELVLGFPLAEEVLAPNELRNPDECACLMIGAFRGRLDEPERFRLELLHRAEEDGLEIVADVLDLWVLVPEEDLDSAS